MATFGFVIIYSVFNPYMITELEETSCKAVYMCLKPREGRALTELSETVAIWTQCPDNGAATRGHAQHIDLFMPNEPDLVTEPQGMFALPHEAWHRSFELTSSSPEPWSSSSTAFGPGIKLTTIRSMKWWGMEELPKKPGLQSRYSSFEVWHFWSQICLQLPFGNQILEGIFFKHITFPR